MAQIPQPVESVVPPRLERRNIYPVFLKGDRLICGKCREYYVRRTTPHPRLQLHWKLVHPEEIERSRATRQLPLRTIFDVLSSYCGIDIYEDETLTTRVSQTTYLKIVTSARLRVLSRMQTLAWWCRRNRNRMDDSDADYDEFAAVFAELTNSGVSVINRLVPIPLQESPHDLRNDNERMQQLIRDVRERLAMHGIQA